MLIAFVVGGSQAMKTAWIEDMLSLIPQVGSSCRCCSSGIRRPGRSRRGFTGSWASDTSWRAWRLLAIGGNLAVESIGGLIRQEHPAIGTVQLFGQTIWLGWLMVAVMILVVPGPFFYGHAKAKLAPKLHNKVLYADADMAKADWTTTVASVVGVLGIGVGLWWLDGAAALFISLGIVRDGYKNTRSAVLDLMDQRARTHDDAEPHPLMRRIVRDLEAQPWVREASVRMRDMGQVFHVEAFVVPHRRRVRLDSVEDARQRIAGLDWKVQDVVVIPVATLPDETVG
ncbi:cation transporter [Microbacterium aurum]